MSNKKFPLGGEFLLNSINKENCFVPENFTDEHKMIYKTTIDFVEGEIRSNDEKIENKDTETVKKIMAAAGELGLLGTDVPEAYGGLGLDKISTAVVTEALGHAGSVAVIEGAHTGIGTMPIVYYGTKEQKEKYLPDSASGKKIHAFCLTESGAGSDAIGGCRAKANLSQDGKHYILNGEKMFITNGGWAEVLIVFAKIEGKDFSAFIVEKDTPGVSSGIEEQKMGIKGSSTTTVIFEDAKIPVENLLYKVGKGHHIAMNVLDIGRYKLGAAALGGAKDALKIACKYAKQRVQFKKPISEFGAIREKIAQMATKCYMGECVIYRTVGLIDLALHDADPTAEEYAEKCTEAIREYSIECAIDKVYGSEILDFCVDECVQIHGGYGYVSEYPAERFYRDARINRIFEGTNEINRLLIPGEIIKKAMKGKLPFMQAGQKIINEIMEFPPFMSTSSNDPLEYQQHLIEMCKKATIFVSGHALQKFMQKIQQKQELLMLYADMIIQIFAMESGLIRTKMMIEREGLEKSQLYINMIKAYMDEYIPKIHQWAKKSIMHVEQGDTSRTLLMGLRKLLKYYPEDSISLNEAIAEKVLEKESLPTSY